MTRLRVLAWLAVFTASTAFAEERAISVGATTRSYVIHLPGGRMPAAPAPLVVVFHGGGGNAAGAARA